MLGVYELGAKPGFVDVTCRRYRCRSCKALCLVVPAGIVSGRRYLWPTIALALCAWSVGQIQALKIREKLSPFAILGASVTGWASLKRWARAYGVGDGTLRERAARRVQALLAQSPLSAQQYAIEPRIFAASLQQA
ncbi:MAG: hypothetical protein GY769_12275 [bacterium]|nr:hypothetical protein [bacterium]